MKFTWTWPKRLVGLFPSALPGLAKLLRQGNALHLEHWIFLSLLPALFVPMAVQQMQRLDIDTAEVPQLWSCSFEFQIQGLSLACSVGFSAKATGWHLHWHRCGAKKQHNRAGIFHNRCTFVFDSYLRKMCFRFHCPGLSALCEEKSCFHSVVLQDQFLPCMPCMWIVDIHPSLVFVKHVQFMTDPGVCGYLWEQACGQAGLCLTHSQMLDVCTWKLGEHPLSVVATSKATNPIDRPWSLAQAKHTKLEHFMTSSTSSTSSTHCQKLGSFELIGIAKTIQWLGLLHMCMNGSRQRCAVFHGCCQAERSVLH